MLRSTNYLASWYSFSAGKRFRCVLLFLILAAFVFHLSSGNSSAEISGISSRSISPEKYGNLLLTRKSISAGKKAVLFTHWTHRMLYTCRVCHFELGFPMGVNGVDITMDKNRNGEFCGFCHDGKEVFGTTEEDCPKCHNGGEAFDYGEKLDRLSWLPESPYGNKVDWNAALDEGDIKPLLYLDKEGYKGFDMNPPEEIEMVSENEDVLPVIFPHARHTYWLDCLNCHPGNVVQRSGKVKFPSQKKYRREFCRGCHSRIAFPMNNCERCHPGMDNDW